MTLRTQLLKRFVPHEGTKLIRKLSVERARLITESYKETEGEPIIIRRAKALKKILEDIPVHIRKGELLVGNMAAIDENQKPKTEVFPEYRPVEIIQELSTGCLKDRLEEREELLGILEYWRGKGLKDRALSLWTEEERRLQERRNPIFIPFILCGIGHTAPGYEKVLKKGLNGIIMEAGEGLKRLNFIKSRDDLEKTYFLKAVVIACNAGITFAERYAILAKKLAQDEADPKRKGELEKIAEICKKVPANPAETFHEALQSFLFCHYIVQIESDGHGLGLGKFDSYMYPYYKNDIEEERITRELAQELLECLFIKLMEPAVIHPEYRYGDLSGGNLFQNMVIGGQTADGKDATNELSYLILDAMESIRLVQPTLSLRYHDRMSDEFLFRALKLTRTGMGMPAYFNDKSAVTFLTSWGIPLEEARQYCCFQSCVESSVQGRTQPHSDPGHLIVLKCLELALNNGVCMQTGEQVGLATGEPASFTTFDELYEAFMRQTKHFLHKLIKMWQVADILHTEMVPLPFLSALIDDCIERGREVHDGGGRYEIPRILLQGIPNTADSLAAVKKLVYEEKRITIEELVDALRRNFEGKEELRQLLLGAPKWGNDDDYVDQFAVRIMDELREEMGKYENPRGIPYTPVCLTVAMFYTWGELCAASPEGRKNKDPIADGGISPQVGRDVEGPTAVIKSVAKIDHPRLSGTLLNLKFQPAVVAGEEGLRKWAGLMKTYFDLGGHHVQYNVVSAETLRDAQKNPEKYRSLIVRVAGYSAYFTELDKEVQDHIILRTEHGL